MVLILIQVYAVFAVPTGSIASTIVFSQLRDSQRQFGPIRAVATIGWMCGCWVISALGADASPLAGYSGAFAWLTLACFTFLLPSLPPPPSLVSVTWRERLGWDALTLLRNPNHRVVFVTLALFNVPMSAFYPFAPQHLKQLGFDRTSAWMTLGQVDRSNRDAYSCRIIRQFAPQVDLRGRIEYWGSAVCSERAR